MSDFIHRLSEEFKDILYIEGEQNARYPYSHSVLIGKYLIDTGISSKRLKKLKTLYPINHVLLSHWHEDHIAGNSLLKNSKFYCHKKDKHAIEDISRMIPFYKVQDTAAEEEFKVLLKILGVENTTIDNTFENNAILNIREDLKLKIIHTPGHTAGHCGFYETNSKIAFLGDMDLTSFPYYANIDSDLMDFEKSIEKLQELYITIAVTGHRAPIEGNSKIKAELDKFGLVIRKRDERILEHISEKAPINASDLKGKNLIYKRYSYENFERISEEIMIEKHFDKFMSKGLIEAKENGFVLS